MPEISRFYGIRVTMYHNDHVPPHFHAQYGSAKAQFLFNGALHKGSLPKSAVRLISQWAQLHEAKLAENWARAMAELPLFNIEPLD